MNLDAAPERLAIRSTLLRSVLLLELDRAGGLEVTVAQLGRAVERQGFTVRGRLGKVISDTLRTELSLGRVSRAGRGRYRLRELPRTTRWRCRQRVRAARAGAAPPWYLAQPESQRPAIPAGSVAAPRGMVGAQGGPRVARRRNEPPTPDRRAALLRAARAARLARRQEGGRGGDVARGPSP